MYVGDLVFANDFRITEDWNYPQGLIFKNQLGQEILHLNENSDLQIWGNLQAESLNIGSSETTALNVTADGKVGIGTTDPQSRFAVANLTPTSSYNTVKVNPLTGDFYYEASSARYKENIRILGADFDQILKVQPRIYTDKESGLEEVGYLAEDFDALGLEHLVIYDEQGQPDALKYDRIPLYLLEVTKEQEHHLSVLDEGMLIVSDYLEGLLADSAPMLSALPATLQAEEAPWSERLALFEQAISGKDDRFADLEARLNDLELALQGFDSTAATVESSDTQSQASDESLLDTLQSLVDSLDGLDSVSAELSLVSESILSVMAMNQANSARLDALDSQAAEITQIVKVVDEKVVIGGPGQYLVLDGATGLEIHSSNFELDREGNLTLSGELRIKGSRINAESGILEIYPGESEDEDEEPKVVVKGNLEVEGKLIMGMRDNRIENEGDGFVEDHRDPVAGTETISAGDTEIILDNNNITENTLINITPITRTFGQVLFISEKRAEEIYDEDRENWLQAGFTVAIEQAIDENIKFNWWILEGNPGQHDDEETESIESGSEEQMEEGRADDAGNESTENTDSDQAAGETSDTTAGQDAHESESESSPENTLGKLLILPTGLGYLNVRSGPAASSLSEIIGQVLPGEEYYYTEINSGWYEITWGESNGWVSGEYVQILYN